ncbi:MAG TPA: helix-turn-helix domain-containing protein [Chitinophagaceae bacterium]|nr:helix-turn-helix domain-containing protein [Chitinophagaceae bacterium]
MQTADSIERNELFDLAFRFVSETNENIFLTGKAGTGKTTFLRYLIRHCAKNVVVAAPTGVAAINAGGVTLHSLFQLPLHPFLPTAANRKELLSRMKFNRHRQQLLRRMELLVIDEISMVRCDVLDAIDTILKSVRRNYNVPFGGVQLLFIGDMFQLPPVAQQQEWEILKEYYSTPFFFDSHVIENEVPLLIELKKIYRQKDDHFVSLLNKVRNNEMSAADFENLHGRYNAAFHPAHDEKYITLTSHNNIADQINHRELYKLNSPSHKYDAFIEGDFPENNYPAEAELILKEGAQVMFLKNDVAGKKYFNGKIGVIKELGDDIITVTCEGLDIGVSKETWENMRYTLNRSDGRLEQERVGAFTQFPLRLAWAITIHKSQGLTFDKVMIDASAAFSSGQIYVALSRCTSLEGIVLMSKISPSVIYSNDTVLQAEKKFAPKGSLAERFEGARQIFTQQLLRDIFSFDNIGQSIEALDQGIQDATEKLNNEAAAWIKKIKTGFAEHKMTGTKFISRIGEMMRTEPVIEKNELLQKRITDAATYFKKQIEFYQQSLKEHPLVTEHREVAAELNELLNQLAFALHAEDYYLQYCLQPFMMASFLRHKLQYIQPRFNFTCYAGSKKYSAGDMPNLPLYIHLKQWRDTVCDKKNLPIYLVANQATLRDIATYLPMSRSDLMKMHGLGAAKADKYGDEILKLVNEYCDKNNIPSNMDAKAEEPKKKRQPKADGNGLDSKSVTLQQYRAGKTIGEIAAERNLAISTIEGHLAWLVGNGDLSIGEMVPKENQSLIKEAIEKLGRQSIKELKEYLPPDISYNEIRLVVSMYRNGAEGESEEE